MNGQTLQDLPRYDFSAGYLYFARNEFHWYASFNSTSVACRDLPTALAWVLRRIR